MLFQQDSGDQRERVVDDRATARDQTAVGVRCGPAALRFLQNPKLGLRGLRLSAIVDTMQLRLAEGIRLSFVKQADAAPYLLVFQTVQVMAGCDASLANRTSIQGDFDGILLIARRPWIGTLA